MAKMATLARKPLACIAAGVVVLVAVAFAAMYAKITNGAANGNDEAEAGRCG